MLKCIAFLISFSLSLYACEEDRSADDNKDHQKESNECDPCKEYWKDGGLQAYREMLINQGKE